MPPVTGPMDERIVLERRSETQDAFGQPIETWSDEDRTPPLNRIVWAAWTDITVSERFRSNQEVAMRTGVAKIRWFPELNAGEWRINRIRDGHIYDIEGLSEPPNTRRQWWLITASASGT